MKINKMVISLVSLGLLICMIMTANISRANLIGDYVWEDSNFNGIQESNEYGIVGINVSLLDSNRNILGQVVTDVDGFYQFQNLDPVEYVLEFTLPSSNHYFTGQNFGADDAVDSDVNFEGLVETTASADNNTVDAGIVQKTSISGVKFHDLNGNGLKDDNEPLLGGWGIEVLLDGNLVADTITDSNGYYSFTNIRPQFGDVFEVREILQSGWYPTTPLLREIAFSSGQHMEVNFGNSTATVPEPATMLLFGTGLAGLVGSRIRRKK